MENATSGSVIVGSGSQKRATGDWNVVLDAERGTALRLNAVVQDSGTPARDVVNNKRWAIAPSLAFGLNGKTRVLLNYLHVDQDNTPDGGVPTVGLPGYSSPDPLRPWIGNAPRVNSKGFYGALSDQDQVKADMFTARVEHDLNPRVKLQNITRYGKTEQDYLLSAFLVNPVNLVTSPVAGNLSETDPSTWRLKRATRTVKDQTNKILTNQSMAIAKIDAGSHAHTLVAGLELTREEQSTRGYSGLGVMSEDLLYAPNPASPVTGLNPVRNAAFTDGQIDTTSLYLFDTVAVGERWIFNGGVRADRYKLSYDGASVNATTLAVTPLAGNAADTLVNGKLSALYKPTPASSVYALVATSQNPAGSNFAISAAANNANNLKYDPQVTNTAELGAKWDLLKQKLSLTAALYRTVVKNDVEEDPVDKLFYQTGRKQVKGIEIGATGEVARGWLVSAGYTRMDAEVISGKAVTAEGNRALSYTPKDAFTAWTSYELPMGLKIGGGARYVGKLLRGTDGAIGTPKFADAYWVVDAMASYAVNKHLDLQLNLYNLADEDYIASINKSGYRYTPGNPRSASLTANFRF